MSAILSIVSTILLYVPYDILTSLFDERWVDMFLEAEVYLIFVRILVLVC